jgi:hypothetical protein
MRTGATTSPPLATLRSAGQPWLLASTDVLWRRHSLAQARVTRARRSGGQRA